jgi:hypothetical protein
MVLPSNASPNNHPNNTAADFTISWENMINFDPKDKWRVAMTEISYIYSRPTTHNNYQIRYFKMRGCTYRRTYQVLYDVLAYKFILKHVPTENTGSYCKYTSNDLNPTINDDLSLRYIPPRVPNENEPVMSGDIFLKFDSSTRFTLIFTKYWADFLGFENYEMKGSEVYIYSKQVTTEQGLRWQCMTTKNNFTAIDQQGTLIPLQRGFYFDLHVESDSFMPQEYIYSFPENWSVQSAEELTKYLQDNTSSIIKSVYYNNITKFISFQIASDIAKVEMLGGLNFLLGFREEVFYNVVPEMSNSTDIVNPTFKADYEVQIGRGVVNMYVYASICKPIYVGHTLAPLLKNVFIDTSRDASKNGNARNYIVYHPMYVPVANTGIDRIEINIRTDDGQLIPFPNGAITTITLHFKKFSL